MVQKNNKNKGAGGPKKRQKGAPNPKQIKQCKKVAPSPEKKGERGPKKKGGRGPKKQM